MSATRTVVPAGGALVFVNDTSVGWSRRRRGRGFVVLDEHGRRLDDPHALARIRALAIPPAWTDVWICPDANGHIQAVGWDARGRKQYRYHARWREERDLAKFDRLAAFGLALPTLRAAVHHDLSQRGLDRTRVVAGVVAMLDRTLLRVGNSRYVEENGSFGLTTLRAKHAKVAGRRVELAFRGKSGVRHRTVLADRTLAALVRRCQELPGQELFQWVDDDGACHPIGSSLVNEYIRSHTDGPFSAKDFRTWGASALVAGELARAERADSARALARTVNTAIDRAAARLGNTRAVCRASYVHPGVVEAFAEGALREPPMAGAPSPWYEPDEELLLSVLGIDARQTATDAA